MNPLTKALIAPLLGKSPLGEDLPSDPMPLFRAWFDEAYQALGKEAGPAMAIATTTPDGTPSVRMVLCKLISNEPPTVTFFTNYESRKAKELEANPKIAAVFHWAQFTRQVRIEGTVARASAEVSDNYFRSRPLLSRLGAWASAQSKPMGAREELVASVASVAAKFGVSGALSAMSEEGDVIPRPPFWGGYEIRISAMELWTNVSGRLHDRARWTYDAQAMAWASTRLQP
ncbi:MAG: pyridoxamine 5'-phosphate oxidase [Phycisphaerales bacterium]|jgi:pyridoxamine 5'-phosphate oxidase